MCGALGSERAASSAHESDPFKATDDGHPQLKGAYSAWRAREYARYVGQSLAAIGLGLPLPTEAADGTVWPVNLAAAMGRPLSLLVAIDRNSDEVCVETALVEIAEGFTAPMLRAALEVSAGLPHGLRLAARRERLVLRFIDSVSFVPPVRLLSVLQDTALIARDLELVFRAQFPCRGLLETVGEAIRRNGVTAEVRGPPVQLDLARQGET